MGCNVSQLRRKADRQSSCTLKGHFQPNNLLWGTHALFVALACCQKAGQQLHDI